MIKLTLYNVCSKLNSGKRYGEHSHLTIFEWVIVGFILLGFCSFMVYMLVNYQP